MLNLPPPAPQPTHEWPVFPRAALHEEISTALTLGRSVMMAEPPGAEDSDIIDDVLAADAERRLIHRVRLRPTFANLTRQALAPILPDGEAPSSTSGLINDAAEHLIRQANGARIVIGVDDGQLLTEQAGQVLAGLARSGTAQLAIRARPVTLELSPWSRLHADGVLASIPLPPLSLEQVRDHLSQAFGPVPIATAHGLHQATGGLLEQLHQLFSDGVGDGWLAPGVDGWVFAAPATAGHQVIEATKQLVQAIPPSLADACDLIALAGPAPLDQVREHSAGVDAAIDRGLVEVREAMVAFWSPISAAAWRGLVSARRSARWLDRIYPTMPAAPPATMVRACLWMVECGRHPGIETLWRAAGEARHQGDPATLLRLVAAGRAALAANDPPPPADLPAQIPADLDRWGELARRHPAHLPQADE